jgi:hypothetical protein
MPHTPSRWLTSRHTAAQRHISLFLCQIYASLPGRRSWKTKAKRAHVRALPKETIYVHYQCLDDITGYTFMQTPLGKSRECTETQAGRLLKGKHTVRTTQPATS